LNTCLDCTYYTMLDKGAEEHSRSSKHFVFQDMVTDKAIGSGMVEGRREFLRKALGND
jgi:hypothetical protein